eukprot:3099625-Rhodomonas_salina.1
MAGEGAGVQSRRAGLPSPTHPATAQCDPSSSQGVLALERLAAAPAGGGEGGEGGRRLARGACP